jgi:tRNA 2-thiouridine synthesizing protein A
MTRHLLDARRLLCPIPVIRTQDAIANYSVGDVVEVTGTDPGIKLDIPAWCKLNGHRVLSIAEENNEIIITIEVSEQA